MYLKRFYDENLAHASYLVGCQATGNAVVIDAGRNVQPYIDEAATQNLTITHVTETHIHADYLSGSRQLAHQTGAAMYLSREGDENWQYGFLSDKDVLVGDGDKFEIGNLTLEVIHTPGHTPEHISFLLTDNPAGGQPIGVFTGDFVFVGDVGRPDLLEKAAGMKDTMKKGAVQLYKSLQRFKKLPDHLQIWPAHGAGSACGKALGAIPSSVLGYEKLTNWAFRCETEQEFVEQILDGQPEPPKYFAMMKKLNKEGPAILDNKMPARASEDMEKAIQEGLLLDFRGVAEYSTSHPAGAQFLPPGGTFVNWAGWLISYEETMYLLLKTEAQLDFIVKGLRSIGLDNVKGYYLESDIPEGMAVRKSRRIKAEEVDAARQPVLDVRTQKEWDEGHLEGAKHIHLGYLKDRLDEVPENPVIHCQSGMRSLMASSLLERAGKDPIDVLGGYMALQERKLVTT